MVTFVATTPAMPSRDVARSIAFYRDVLGFDVLHRAGEFAVLGRDDVRLSLWGAGDDSWQTRADWTRPVCSGAESFIAGTASFRIEVQGGVDELYAACEARGVVHPKAHVEDTHWGTREFSVLDPDGNLVALYEERAS
jgi:catechol 2,3-dioxygenase-like lactoylglutathione lyase family enzyme